MKLSVAINIVLSLLCLLPTTAASCQGCSFINFTKDNGLPSNTIYNIYRDDKGLLWIGTDKGVVTYDGTSYDTYTTADGLADNEVFFFQQDKRGRIWMSTASGALCYYQNGRLYNQNNDPALKLTEKASTINFIKAEADSSVTIGFLGYPLVINICNDRIQYIRLSHIFPTQPCPEIGGVKKINANRYQLYTYTGIYTVDSQGTAMNYSNYANGQALIYSIMQGEEYLVNEYGIYNMEQQKILAVHNRHILRRQCRIYKDGRNFFIATFNGLFVNDDMHLLDNIRISSLTQDINGNYWIGTLDKGIYLLGKKFSETKEYAGVYKGEVKFAYAAGEDIFFATGDNNLYHFKNGKTRCIAASGTNRHQPAGQHGCIIKGKEYYAFYNQHLDYVQDIYTEKKSTRLTHKGIGGNIKNIYGTGRDMHLVYSSEIVALTHQAGMRRAMHTSPVPHARQRLCGMGMDEDGNIYYNTADSVFKLPANGTISYQPAFGNVSFKWGRIFGKHFVGSTTQNQLWVGRFHKNGIAIDSGIKHDCIWNNAYMLDSAHILISTSGMYRILATGGNSAGKPAYSVQVLENPFIPKTPDHIVSNGSNCYFFHKGSILSVSIATLLQKAQQPTVYFTSIKTAKNEYAADSTLQLPYDEAENLHLNFNAISTAGHSLQYEYSVSKNNIDHWYPIQNREISLTSPGYGNYQVKVRAKTLSSGYSLPAAILLSINKPFWLSVWFISLFAMLVCGVAISIVHFIIKQKLLAKERQHEVKIKFMKSEYQALNALMNPHFIFNSLNNIQSFINNDDKSSANKYLNIFSRLVRQNMQNISKELIPLQKEIDLVHNYLVLEKLRFHELLNFTINIDEAIDLDAIKVPPLLLQPLVENAIKHGLLPKQSGDNNITITITEKGELVQIEIEDNGIGLTHATAHNNNHESFALGNIKTRVEKLSEIYKQDICFSIAELKTSDGDVAGTRATIVIAT